MIKLLIFDFDDTIVHLGVDWDNVKADVIALAKRHGVVFEMKEHLIPLSNRLEQCDNNMKKAINSIYLKYEMECAKEKNYQFTDGIESLLNELKKKGYILAIASGNNTKTIETILRENNLLELFDIICGRDCIARNKPEPDQLLWIINKAKVRKENAIFIGDSKWDGLAGKNAGIKTVVTKPWTAELMRKELREEGIV